MFTEKSAIEDYLVEKFRGGGWQFVPADELERESLEEPLLLSFSRVVGKINKDIGIGEKETRQVINELKLRSSGMEGSKDVLNYFKSGIPVKLEKERIVERVKLFDYKNLENNEFIVSRQVYYRTANKSIRVDLILYVNGIPLVIIECKSPVSFSVSWFDAYEKIKDYERSIPELFKYVQIGVAAESVAKYFPIVPWQEEGMEIGEWKIEGKDSIDSLIEMLSPSTLLDVIKNFLFFKVKFGSATKILPRYMQYRATNRIVDRVLDNLSQKDDRNKGLVWHWQGSGKTLTMIFSSHKLFYAQELENPSIFLIVDRQELEEQLYQEFASLDLTKPERISSVEELRKIMVHDNLRGKRGIFITLIHKFRPEELNEFGEELEQISEDGETITTRKNIIAFIDEGHRTQYGVLASQMKSILKNAFFFAFTGTPIAKEGRDTFSEFSYPPKEAYLDKYFIIDSIHDGFTVKIAYQPRLEKDVHLRKNLLDAFLKEKLEELPENIKEVVQEKVREKLNAIKVFLENPKRIDTICKDVAEHFKENADGKFKAMIVAGSRKACVLYKKKLDELLPKEYSEVVITYSQGDSHEIGLYHDKLMERFMGLDDEEIRKTIVGKFKEETFPKILIVTEMLLTGFDAPIMQVMYLDKPLKEHRLLQAIARTNRPFKGLKDCGLIIDYVGILAEFKKAFRIYSGEDLKGVLCDFGKLREEFTELTDKCMAFFKDIPKDKYDRDTLLRAFEIITSDEVVNREFLGNVRLLRRKFELLGPDEIKVKLFAEYKWIMAVHTYYQLLVSKTDADLERYVETYFSKTIKHIHNTIEIQDLRKNTPVISFDANYLRKLEAKISNKKEKAANIVFALNKFVLVDRYKNPIYETLSDKVERILNMWRQKSKDYEKIYKEGARVVEEMENLSKRQKELGLSNLEYSILLILEKKFPELDLKKDTKELISMLRKKMFPGWTSQKTVMKEIERDVRRFLRRYVKPYSLDIKEIDTISGRIKHNLEEYGKG